MFFNFSLLRNKNILLVLHYLCYVCYNLSYMRRSFCVLTTVLKGHNAAMFTSKEKYNLVADFKDWKFHSPPNYSQLPIDESPEYNVPVAVKNAIFSKVPTEPITGNIRLVCASDVAMMEILNLDPKVAETEEFIDFVSGKSMPDGALTVSHRYGGYQFGFWADQLGDGRAHILGEYVNSEGESWQLQLKGSGETPYSRFGDGRAVLRSSVREMVASEACRYLGVPTTRAAALVVSDDSTVWRDKSYSGRTRQERAAVVLRLAPCWYRFGSLEILAMRKEPDLERRLCDHIIQVYFPEIDSSAEDKYVKWFAEVAHRSLDMVASWQGVGFTHGVLNTDNMSILGLTIDYGPFGFIDYYNEHYVPNTSDDMGRYAFNRQPDIVLWNIGKLYTALTPILTDVQKVNIEGILETLKDYVKNKVLVTYLTKLGLSSVQDGDEDLVHDFLALMQQTSADFTATFRQLAETELNDLLNKESLSKKWSLQKMAEAKTWEQWVDRYRERLLKENVSEECRGVRARNACPVYVPRNWMLQEAITDAENNDFEKVRFLLKIMEKPFEENPLAEKKGYSSQPPSWAYGLKLSCSS